MKNLNSKNVHFLLKVTPQTPNSYVAGIFSDFLNDLDLPSRDTHDVKEFHPNSNNNRNR